MVIPRLGEVAVDTTEAASPSPPPNKTHAPAAHSALSAHSSCPVLSSAPAVLGST
jgi:hypothetical protein